MQARVVVRVYSPLPLTAGRQSDAPHRPVERKSARPLAHGSAVAYFLSFHVSVLSEPARFIAQALARRDHSLLLLPTSSCPSATLQCEPCPCICAAPCARPDRFYRSTAGSLHIRRIVQYAHALLRRPVPSPHRKLSQACTTPLGIADHRQLSCMM